MLGKNFSRWYFEIFFLYFLENRIANWHLRIKICIKCQSLFSGKKKDKKNINLSSDQRVEKRFMLYFTLGASNSMFCSLLQMTLVISEILRDIRTSTYQICRIEEKINQTTTFHKWIYNLTPEDREILKILWKSGEIDCIQESTVFSVS